MKKTKLKWWYPLAAVAVVFMAYDFLQNEGLENLGKLGEELGLVEAEKSTTKMVKSKPVQSIPKTTPSQLKSAPVAEQAKIQTEEQTSSSLISSAVANTQQAILTPRQVAVPSYNTLVEAARLIQQANNINVMKDYISLEQSRRNLMLRKQNAELETSLKETEAKYYEANARIEHLQENGMLSPGGMGMNMGSSPFDPNPSVEASEPVKLMGLKKMGTNKYELILKINNIIYSSVKVGQTAGKYKIAGIDARLNCVRLSSVESKNDDVTVCLN